MINLDRLVNVLGGYGARLVGAEGLRRRELRSVAMHDPTDDAPPLGDAFLAVGVDSAGEAVHLAEQARATVVLLRSATDPGEDVRAHLRERGLALLVVDPAVSWSQISGVVYGLVLEGRETEAGRGPSDLFTLADTVAAEVGGPVTIEDRASRVVAYSASQGDTDRVRRATVVDRAVPAQVRERLDADGVFAGLASSAEPRFVPGVPELGLGGRTAAPIRVGRELLGSLWVVCDAPLGAERSRALREGAHTVGLHMLRARVSSDLERQVESESVIDLLEGSADPAQAAGRLGLLATGLRVIAFQAWARTEPEAAILHLFEQVTTGFGWSRPGRSTLLGTTVYTVLPCGNDPSPAVEWVRSTVRGLPDQLGVVAGVGGAADPAGLPASRQEADECLTLHAQGVPGAADRREARVRPGAGPGTPGGAGPVVYDDAWHAVLLRRLRLVAEAGRLPTRNPVVDLARHDAEHGTDYARTLRAWLYVHGDLGRAAELLELHPNTVRYRLRRMGGVADLPLDDPEARVAMTIALAALVDDPPDLPAGHRSPHA
ncbi:helix-turn-helix domain-containing protein [Nocardiopsis sp. CT-R113]|uniref:Helix-turn-helix domain-containing protein n=1 Tax=Nocardiopsis codii TaxID=3065942 RepID=A0ABU7K2P1_9ACTN|nr:helix-turn-helix domain-containing protein [Nocardiopsis sp. CT-R113]MEE2036337.1 helix-turn-helix domain-containing protein [Nocardiopsis sp. CT-R113]